MKIFKLLSDQTRARIILLLDHAPMCALEIIAVTNQTQSKIQRHLNYLHKHNVVTSVRNGKRVVYSLRKNSVLSSLVKIIYTHKLLSNHDVLTYNIMKRNREI